MAERWVTSDFHLGHKNILKYDDRPFDTIEQHDEELITRWNMDVKEKDEVYFLGDLMMGRKDYEAVIKRLNGKIHLILGNHDKELEKVKYKYLLESVQFLKILKFRGEGIARPGGKLCVTLCHYAMRVWYRSHHPDSWHLYGNSHGNLPDTPSLSFDVGIMIHDYRLLHWETIRAIMRERLDHGYGPTPHHLEEDIDV